MLRKRGANSWQVVVYVDRDPLTGKSRYLRRTVRGGQRAARTVERQLEQEAVAARRTIRSDATLAELLDRWFEHAKPDLATSTAYNYGRYIERVVKPRLGDVRITELTAAGLDAFYDEIRKSGGADGGKLSPTTVRHVHAIIRRALRQAARWGWIDRNPAADADPPTPARTRDNPPDPEAVVRLLEVAAELDADLATFLRLAVITGARRGELCALRWSDVDLDAGTVTIARSIVALPGGPLEEKATKTGGVRTVALDVGTVEALRTHRARAAEVHLALGAPLAEDAHLFESAPGVAWRPDRATHAYREAADKAGVKTRLHDLRHYAITQLLAGGHPVRQVSGRAGHASAKMTLDVYGHVIPAGDQALADALAATLKRRPKAATR